MSAPRELPRFPWSASSRWRPGLATAAILVVGLWLFGTAEALLVASRLGNSPWTVLAEGVSKHSPLSIGGATLTISALVLAAWWPLRERPGLGTVANMVVIAVAIDVMLQVLPSPSALPGRLAEVLAGVVLVGVASALYLSTHLGPGPRDGLMTGLRRRTGLPISVVRTGLEGMALLGWLLGGRVGIGTLLWAALVGLSVAGSLRALVAGTAALR